MSDEVKPFASKEDGYLISKETAKKAAEMMSSKVTDFNEKFKNLPKERRDEIERKAQERLRKIRAIDMALEDFFDGEEEEVKKDGDKT